MGHGKGQLPDKTWLSRKLPPQSVHVCCVCNTIRGPCPSVSWIQSRKFLDMLRGRQKSDATMNNMDHFRWNVMVVPWMCLQCSGFVLALCHVCMYDCVCMCASEPRHKYNCNHRRDSNLENIAHAWADWLANEQARGCQMPLICQASFCMDLIYEH
uniref:Uncharacterized protein n=1 Tax=Eutreptiella gymnastica TaxID=73025 RepID=A0A7S4GDB8_9EUGL|mmetsp:Transcript_87074/g.145281  ORF Transcript_87074/g.145281 Transcript_87074/m.145281 type:complete len:156 (+) Transcript_87074:142-609(+)